MPKGVYQHKGTKGIHKGKPAWNKGLEGWNLGEKNGFYGKHHTQETIKKNRLAHLGKIISEQTILKLKRKSFGYPK